MIIVSTKEVLEGLKTRFIEAREQGNIDRVLAFSEALVELQKLLEVEEEALRRNEYLERRAGRTLPQG